MAAKSIRNTERRLRGPSVRTRRCPRAAVGRGPSDRPARHSMSPKSIRSPGATAASLPTRAGGGRPVRWANNGAPAAGADVSGAGWEALHEHRPGCTSASHRSFRAAHAHEPEPRILYPCLGACPYYGSRSARLEESDHGLWQFPKNQRPWTKNWSSDASRISTNRAASTRLVPRLIRPHPTRSRAPERSPRAESG